MGVMDMRLLTIGMPNSREMSSPVFTAGGHQMLGLFADLVIDVLTENVEVGVGTIEQVYAHGYCAHVQVFLLYHFVGFENLVYVNHNDSV